MLCTSPVRNNYKGWCLWAQENKSFTLNAGNKELHVYEYKQKVFIFCICSLDKSHWHHGWFTAADRGGMSPQPSQALQVSMFLQWSRKWSKNDGVFVFWHFFSLRPHQGWAWQTSSVNLGFLPSVSPSAARLGGGRWALAENDPSGLIVFWSADWHWEEKQRHGKRKRGGWVLMHLVAIREAYLTVWAQHANTHKKVHSVKYNTASSKKGREKKSHTAQSGTPAEVSTYTKVKALLLLKEFICSTKHPYIQIDTFTTAHSHWMAFRHLLAPWLICLSLR